MMLEEYSWFHGDARGVKQGKVPPASHEEAFEIEEVHYVAYGVLAPIIVSIGIIGNLLVLLLLRLPQFRGAVFSYFTVLATADFLSLVLCISPLHHILAGATLHHSTAVWYSHFELIFVGVAMSTSVLVVVSITVHRFFSVCRPTEFKRFNTPRFAWLCMAAALGVSIVAWFPTTFLREPEVAEECETSTFIPPDNRTWWVACLANDVGDKGYFVAYTWVRQTLVSFLPIIIVVSLNILTLRGFLRHRKVRQTVLHKLPSGEPADHTNTKEERVLIGLLLAVMISFAITIIPSGIANAINITMDTTELNFVIFNAVANLLEILYHTLNFYLYVLCSKPVRDSLKEYYDKYSSDFNILVRMRVKARGAMKDERMRKSESPLSETVQIRDSDKVYAISSARLDSNVCVGAVESDLGHEENRVHENGMKKSESPLSETVENRGSEKVYAISCEHLDSNGCVSAMESDIGSVENKVNENGMKKPQSPLSETVENRDSEKVHAISCAHLDSSRCASAMESNLGREENRVNENIRENLFPHIIIGKKDSMERPQNGHDNPNFEFGE